MTWHLDPPVRVGPRTFAALTKVRITAYHAGPVVTATADKQPLTVLMFAANEVTALDLDGQTHTAAETAHAYPDAVRQLRSFISSKGSDLAP